MCVPVAKLEASYFYPSISYVNLVLLLRLTASISSRLGSQKSESAKASVPQDVQTFSKQLERNVSAF